MKDPKELEGSVVRDLDPRETHRRGTVIGWRSSPPAVRVSWNSGRITWIAQKSFRRYEFTP